MPRFSILSLMLLTVAVAVGFGEARRERSDWADGFLAACSVLVIGELIRSARALTRWMPTDAPLTRAQRSGWWFAIAWRVATAAALAVLLVADEKAWTRGISTLSSSLYGGSAVTGLYPLLLLLAMSGLSQLPRKPVSAPWLTHPLALILAILMLLVVMYDLLLVNVLVHIAIVAIEMVESPARLNPEIYDGLNLAAVTRAKALLWPSAAVTLGGLAGLIFAWRSASAHRPGHRWIAALAVVLVIIAASCYDAWLFHAGLRQLSPAFHESRDLPTTLKHIGVGVPLLLILSMIAARRWSASRIMREFTIEESRILRMRNVVVLSITASCAARIVTIVVQTDLYWTTTFGERLAAFALFATHSDLAFIVAGVIAGVAILWRRWRSPLLPVAGIAELPPGRFVFVCGAFAALVLLTLPPLIMTVHVAMLTI